MRKKFLKPLILAFAAIIVASCASIYNGTSQEITVNSNVSGALVELNGVELGYTPFRGKIKRGKTSRIKVSKSGYLAGDVELIKKRDENGLMIGNAVLGLVTFGTPFFAKAYYENFYGYPERKRDYEDRASRGETGMSEEVPRNEAVMYIDFGILAGATAFVPSVFTDLSTGASWEYSPSSYYVQLKEVGQPSSDYSNELSIRYFATMNHSQIAIDAGSNGEYAEALANIMEVKMDSEAARQSINEALEESKGDQVMFGDALMERFRRQ